MNQRGVGLIDIMIATIIIGGDKRRIMALIENFAKEISDKGGSVTLVEFA